MKIWLVLLLSALTSYMFISTYFAYFLFVVLIYWILSDLHIINGGSLNLGTFKNSTLFYKRVTGPYNYNTLNPYFEEACNVLGKFNLNNVYEYNSFGMYLDDPKKVDEKNLRSCIGIAFTPSDGSMKCKEELINYCKSNGYEMNDLPAFPAIVSRYPLVSYMFVIFAIKSFYSMLNKNIEDVDFCRRMRIKVENIPCIIDLYRPKMVEFYVPKVDKEEEKEKFKAFCTFNLDDKKNN